MFFKNMEQVSVEVDDSNGNIFIKQENAMQQEHETIMITADQVDNLISWLQEAKSYSTRDISKE